MAIVEIHLTKGKVAIIDAEDAGLVSGYKWHATQHGKIWYAASSANRRRGECIYMHRLVLSAPKDLHVDHINGNPLDNRRENLRLCTNAENRRNMRKYTGVSRFKGVAACKTNANRKWEAYIWFNNKKIGLGTYVTEEEAARAYNASAVRLHGEFACLNFIPGLTYEESVAAPDRNTKLGRPFAVRAG